MKCFSIEFNYSNVLWNKHIYQVQFIYEVKFLALKIHKYFSTWKQLSKINWALIKCRNIRVHKSVDK